MTSEEYAREIERFANALTCYLYGFWGQYLSQAEYSRVNALPDICGKNDKFNNQKYIGTGVFPFDCINLVKGILGGATVERRISYAQMAANPMGDITNEDFLKLMQARGNVNPKDAKRGMGLASKGHAGVALGNGMWADANFIDGKQNGVMIHNTGIEQFTCAGELPGVEYNNGVKVGDIIPMTVTKIENGIAYGQAEVTPAEITVGSKVTIDPGAKAGGTNKKYRGLAIDPQYANGKYVDVVQKIETHYGVEEALLKNIVTWVAVSSLKLA